MVTNARAHIEHVVERLPPVGVVAMELLRTAGDPDAGAADAASLVMRDAVLTGVVLQEANSAMYAPRQQISTVPSAIALIGMNRVTAIAIAASARVALPGSADAYGADAASVQQHQRLTVEAGLALGGAFAPEDRAELATVCVLHDVGKLVLSALGPGWLGETGLLTAGTDAELIDLERDLFDVHHGTVGAMVCAHWKLPPAIGRAVEHHHHPQSGDLLAHGVMLADVISNAVDPDHQEPVRPVGSQLDHSLEVCGVGDLGLVVDRVERLMQRAEPAAH